MKKTDSDNGKHAAGRDPLIVEIAADAHGDDEQLWALTGCSGSTPRTTRACAS
ncbi:MAG: hypothetical protein U9R74_10535 [Pseudomonadota bacterium]|nr:hypothetical protein [Pseudomonadota bacterium]